MPSISLPKGGGAIRGMGEKFAANPVSGTGSMTVPIPTSPGRSGFGPQLSLSYDSGSGNGPFGFGWSLSLPSITRKTDKGLPRYDDTGESDVYILSGAEDLVPVLEPDGRRHEDRASAPGFTIHRYRPRIEGLFARIERWTDQTTGEIHWRSITRENVTTLYGRDNQSRVFDPADPDPAHPARIYSWLICTSHDDKGNAIVYEYAAEDDAGVELARASEHNRTRTAHRYLKRIKYGNRVSRLVQPDLSLASWLFEVVFDYDEAHHEELALDPALDPAAQHRRVRASCTPGAAWTTRPDPFSSHRAGFEIRSHRRCHRVLMFHRFPELNQDRADELGDEPYLVRSLELDYADLDDATPPTIDAELGHQGSTRFASFVRSITQSGFVRDDSEPVVERNGVKYITYLRRSLPPLEFEYSKARIQDEIRHLDASSAEHLPVGLDGATYQWVDLDGEGVSGILTEQGGAWRYKPNLGEGRFGAPQVIRTKPSLFGIGGGGAQLLDLSGNGQLDVVSFAGPTPGFYERTQDERWEPFRTFRKLPALRWDDPNLRFVDLDGDGHADILITEHDVFTWYPSLAEDGFGPARQVRPPRDEERGPRLVLADGTQSIYLADLCGDGLTDLVRIRNGEVCYWPNLGHGRFGAKITMDNPPRFDDPDRFDQRRVRLADIDGSGTTDIIYLGRDGVRLYFNQSGNRWSEARPLPFFPRVDHLSSITTADLLGNGTACLVWSSPLPADARRPLRYLDLMGGQKPHLLIRSANNLGAETRVEYASSTKFYLADKAAGKPWITRLPFPVHVVERVETYDHISRNRFVTRYSYHHGYFDGHERELQGFGLVEQIDTEELAALSRSDGLPADTNVDAASHVPPVLTRSWYHTGVYFGRGHISDFFAGLLDEQDPGEYFREPGLTDAQARALLLEDTVLPAELTVDEERQACRALKGSLLRQEVYSLDASDKEPLPYSVTERSYAIKRLQMQGANRDAVFFAHPHEEVVYNYERTLAPVVDAQIMDPATAGPSPTVTWCLDPRTAHSLTLEIDDFGNVLKSASIGYGRRFADATLSLPAQAEQTRTHVTYVESRATNGIDEASAYRPPVVCDTRTYELTGYAPTGPAGRFATSDFVTPIASKPGSYAAIFDDELEYQQGPTGGKQRRLIEHVRTLFRRDDLVAPLPLAQLQSMALPFETYQLALTPGLITHVFGDRVDASMLDGSGATPGGRYVHTRDENGTPDSGWWIPSGSVLFSPDPADTAAQEHAHARVHFFLPHRARDPFHTPAASTESFVRYDGHDLLVAETRDALGNRIVVDEQDYRVLQPALVKDPNGNRMGVAFDALGMVAGTAVMGKEDDTPARGDRLTPAFRVDLTEAEIALFFADPKGPLALQLLDDATTRVIYDLTCFWREPDPSKKGPAFVATLARETHASEPVSPPGARLQVACSYSDGFGREVQQKLQAEPGPVPARDPQGALILDAEGQPRLTSGSVSPRWIASGWTVFNNKGKPVRQYEPYFSDTHRFELDVQIGKSPILCYDPLSRVVATILPNHAWEKVVFDPWRQVSWDASDTVLVPDPAADPDVGDFFARLPETAYLPTWHARRRAGALGPDEQEAAQKSEMHAGTPTVAHADSLGRIIATVAHNRFKYSDAPAAEPPLEERYETRSAFDIEGNQREVIDARGRVVFRYDYDMLGTRIHQASMEAGERWTLNDVAGKPLYAWTSRGYRFRTTHDALQRPTASFLSDGDAAERLIGRSVYGESRPAPEVENLRGRLVELFDQAGMVISEAYDFKGNLLRSSRRLVQALDGSGRLRPEYKATIDWSTSVELEAETYITETRYDALNRPVQMIAPHSNQAGSRINVIQPGYNDANLLERVDVWLDHGALPQRLVDRASTPPSAVGVENIDYDAKGQRVRIDYKNGAWTRYDHDPETFRLTRLHTRRGAAFPEDRDGPQPPPSTIDEPPPGGTGGAQHLLYTYDAAGNITRIRDLAQQTIYFRNAQVDPSVSYTYDATFRLIEATGREHLGQVGGAPAPHSYNDAPRAGLLHPNDGNAMGRYLERYVYDAVGNVLSMQHRGTAPPSSGWTRAYSYEEPSQLEPGKHSNRLSCTTIGGGAAELIETYSVSGSGYDAHGNMLRMPQLHVMQWNERDQLQMTQRQAVNDDDTAGVERHGERTWCVYDAGGQRVRKVTELASGVVKDERIYLGGFEIYRRYGANALVRETLHVMDGEQRIALVETRTQGDAPGDPTRLIRYQLSNHLGSACLELDEQARVISYEEYTPFGSTSYQAVESQTHPSKRWRYAGKERDDETGLTYYGGRYCASWLGRWTSFDPALIADRDGAKPASSSPTAEGRGAEPREEESAGAEPEGVGPHPGGASSQGTPPEPRAPRPETPSIAAELNGYCYALDNPVNYQDPDGLAPVPIGHVYVIRGTLGGQAVTYTGSTAQELMQRLGSRHKWHQLITAESTTVTAYEVRAELNAAASGRGTLFSARNEALRSAEQRILSQIQKGEAIALNEIRAATPEHAARWRQTHAVQVGRGKLTLKGGVRLGAFAGFALLDIFNMYREQKTSRYVYAPYVLEDEGGQFTLSEERAHWFAHHYRWKVYQAGPRAGEKVEIEASEFDFWKKEGELLWGTTDFWGDFVPGLLRPTLPVVSGSGDVI